MSDKILLVIFMGIFASENYQFCGFVCYQVGLPTETGEVLFKLENPTWTSEYGLGHVYVTFDGNYQVLSIA